MKHATVAPLPVQPPAAPKDPRLVRLAQVVVSDALPLTTLPGGHRSLVAADGWSIVLRWPLVYAMNSRRSDKIYMIPAASCLMFPADEASATVRLEVGL